MFVHTHRHRVRYRECDPMNVVYHAHYADYFEYARTEALRHLGIVYRELEESGIIMPVVDLTIRYRRPALYDDMLEIRTVVEEIPRTRINIDYVVTREGETDQLVTGKVVLCFVDRDRGRPIPAPTHVVEVFSRAIGMKYTASGP